MFVFGMGVFIIILFTDGSNVGILAGNEEGTVLFNNALNTFNLKLISSVSK